MHEHSSLRGRPLFLNIQSPRPNILFEIKTTLLGKLTYRIWTFHRLIFKNRRISHNAIFYRIKSHTRHFLYSCIRRLYFLLYLSSLRNSFFRPKFPPFLSPFYISPFYPNIYGAFFPKALSTAALKTIPFPIMRSTCSSLFVITDRMGARFSRSFRFPPHHRHFYDSNF